MFLRVRCAFLPRKGIHIHIKAVSPTLPSQRLLLVILEINSDQVTCFPSYDMFVHVSIKINYLRSVLHKYHRPIKCLTTKTIAASKHTHTGELVAISRTFTTLDEKLFFHQGRHLL